MSSEREFRFFGKPFLVKRNDRKSNVTPGQTETSKAIMIGVTKESIIEKTYRPENLAYPFFAKRLCHNGKNAVIPAKLVLAKAGSGNPGL